MEFHLCTLVANALARLTHPASPRDRYPASPWGWRPLPARCGPVLWPFWGRKAAAQRVQRGRNAARAPWKTQILLCSQRRRRFICAFRGVFARESRSACMRMSGAAGRLAVGPASESVGPSETWTVAACGCGGTVSGRSGCKSRTDGSDAEVIFHVIVPGLTRRR